MSEIMCPVHNVAFFKRGKMKAYAHPIEENGATVGWCNMKDVLGEPTEPGPQPVPEHTEIKVPKEPAPQEIGMWIKEVGELLRLPND